jgi:predicted DNA-binding transcriptional regulator YafY
MNRIDRLFGILVLLQSKKFLPAEKIAEKFGISVRTVYRDVKALGEQGIPVSFEPNKGYFIVDGYFLPPVSFTSDEASALLLMERLVQGFADRSIKRHYTTALTKIKAVLRHKEKEKLEALDDNMKLQLPSRMVNDFDHLSLLQNAISSKTIVTLEYKNSREEVTTRQVEPVGLIFYAFNWHLVAWCHLRQEYRDFKVSRIVKSTRTELCFTKEKHISVSEYMKLLPVAY